MANNNNFGVSPRRVVKSLCEMTQTQLSVAVHKALCVLDDLCITKRGTKSFRPKHQRRAQMSKLRYWLKQLPISRRNSLLQEVQALIKNQLAQPITSNCLSTYFSGTLSLIDLVNKKLPVEKVNCLSTVCFQNSKPTILQEDLVGLVLEEKIVSAIPNWGNVTELTLQSHATDEMCGLISQHCPQLENLDLQRSEVSSNGIYALAGRTNPNQGCFKLKNLNLYFCSPTKNSVWRLLQSCPFLQDVGLPCADLINKKILEGQDSLNFQSSLLHYDNLEADLHLDHCLTVKINNIFPYLAHVTLFINNENSIESLKSLNNLKTVQLEHVGQMGIWLFNLLKAKGSNLTKLRIDYDSDEYQILSPLLRLTHAFCATGNLVELEMLYSSLPSAELIMALDEHERLFGSNPEVNYNSLELVTIKQLEPEDYEEDPEDYLLQESPEIGNRSLLMDFLAACPNLKRLALVASIDSYFNDVFISEVLHKNKFEHLTSFNVEGGINTFFTSFSPGLTISSARRLLNLPSLSELFLRHWRLTVFQRKRLGEYAKERGVRIRNSRTDHPQYFTDD